MNLGARDEIRTQDPKLGRSNLIKQYKYLAMISDCKLGHVAWPLLPSLSLEAAPSGSVAGEGFRHHRHTTIVRKPLPSYMRPLLNRAYPPAMMLCTVQCLELEERSESFAAASSMLAVSDRRSKYSSKF